LVDPLSSAIKFIPGIGPFSVTSKVKKKK